MFCFLPRACSLYDILISLLIVKFVFMKIEFPFRNFPFVGLLSGMFLILSSGSLQADPIRKGPQPLKPAEHGIGQLVKAFSFSDINGEQHTFGSEHTSQLTAFCFTSTSCPLSRKYLPTLAKLSQSAPAHVQYILVNPIQILRKSLSIHVKFM